MSYLLLKALHVAAVLAWIGGLVLLGVVLRGWRTGGALLLPHEQRVARSVLHWDRRVTQPAMALAWALGLGLASWGGWLGTGWLTVKFGVVVALSALHGALTATLRRRLQPAAASRPSASLLVRWGPVIALLGAGFVAGLVVVKPF